MDSVSAKASHSEQAAYGTARRTLHQRLTTQRALLGFLQIHSNTTVTEMAGLCGYDFVLLDGEHGVFTERDYLEALRVLAATDALAMIRLPKHDTQALGRYLDMGVDAIVVPNVWTVEQANTLARAMRYPPKGTRALGASLHRATHYGINASAHRNDSRHHPSLIVIIESKAGVDNAEEILAVEGVDGALIGPWDLTAGLGCPGDFSSTAYTQAVTRIEQAALAQHKPLGTAPHPGHPLEALVGRHHRILIIDDDATLIRETMTARVSKTRASYL